nr:hypothetical protein [Tanacetum cinerariifolium]
RTYSIENEEGDRYTWKVIRVEYVWKPSYRVECKCFGHDPNSCPKRVKVDTPKALPRAPTPSSNVDNKDGFMAEKEKGQVPKEKCSTKDNDTSNPFHVDEVVSSKNSFMNLMGEDSGLDEVQNVSSPVNADGNDKGMKDEDDDSNDDEEVYMPNDMHGGGFMDDLEDDLNCYEAYRTQVYDLTPQEQAFYDQYDIRLNSHGRK